MDWRVEAKMWLLAGATFWHPVVLYAVLASWQRAEVLGVQAAVVRLLMGVRVEVCRTPMALPLEWRAGPVAGGLKFYSGSFPTGSLWSRPRRTAEVLLYRLYVCPMQGERVKMYMRVCL